ELLESFFAPGEVSELWITFHDPQMKKVTKRLTGTRFMQLYRKVMPDGGVVRLKSDSPFLYAYTRAMVQLNGQQILVDTSDLYHSDIVDPILNIRTHYESQWLARGLSIKYLAFALDHNTTLQEPEDDFERDTYRSYSRGYIPLIENPEL
ncbi:MAG: tRNA (guanosine(46)-N7)-methyltransferase TrmB, partial [Muribaculaceae bacterium]